jgi:hypothetical protein
MTISTGKRKEEEDHRKVGYVPDCTEVPLVAQILNLEA